MRQTRYFLTTAFILGSDTGKFFGRLKNADVLEHYSWIFDPKEALLKSDEAIKKGCAEFFRPAGYNSWVVHEWPYNLRLLGQIYEGDIRKFFDSHNGDSEKIIEALMVRPRAKSKEKRDKNAFTRYGPKIAALVVQWMRQYGLYKFRDSHEGRVPVDFQVARVLIQTGAVILNQPENAHQVTTTIDRALMQICSENGWQSREVSEALWNIGNLGCNNRNHDKCPVSNECVKLISRKPYDKNGKFDPKDTGRWD